MFEYHESMNAATAELIRIAEELRDLELDDGDVISELRAALAVVHLADHRAAMLTGALARLDVAARGGRRPREVLMSLGCAPSVAARMLRVGAAAEALPVVMAHAADGALSAEHVDAVVKGANHIRTRSAEPVDEDARYRHQVDLLGQALSGATPADIADRARKLGNQLAEEQDGLPAAEDRSINEIHCVKTSEGRWRVRGDLDAEVGVKLAAALEEGSAPRPEPNGTPDLRPAERRRADALEAVLDTASRAGDSASPPRTQLLLTVPANTPDAAELEFMGPISLASLSRLSCDTSVTTIIVDGHQVPLDMGHDKRLFPAHLRKALYLRDRCCIKCGAPASRTHCHHIQHWIHQGETSLNNGCLLCPGCHADVHHNGWNVILGYDKHPWLIPPATVDPQRTPLPAYNRRTMHLDAAA